MAIYNSISGKNYALGKELGAGGEGIVYEVLGDNSKVAKIYKSDKFKTVNDRILMDKKLRAMIRMNIPVYVDGKLRLAWPLDILYQNGSMTGFIMPKIHAKCKIFDIQRVNVKNPTDPVMKIYPNYTWKYSVQFAYNLSWVVKYVHEKNIVIGDFNQNNIYVDTSTGAVILIDCDSFDIKDPMTGEHFRCEVGLPEMLAPELQTVGNLKNGSFQKETDNFSLAIHIFRLLMRNADPFGGIITTKRSVSSIPANVPILNGECPYVRSIPGKVIPRWSPTLDMLPSSLQGLFNRTFNYDSTTARKRIQNRATASEWCNALAVLAAPEPNPSLQTCKYNYHHVYPKHNSYCPWCKCDNPPPPPPPPPPVQTKTTNTNTPSKQSGKTNANNNNQQSVSTIRNTKVRRTPYLFYIILIAFGLASGFAFGEIVSTSIYSVFDEYIDPMACTIFLSIVGVIGAALIAHHFEDQYIHADNAIPWLCMGLVALFIPLLVALVLGVIAGIIIAIFAIIIGILAVFFAIICIGTIISSS